MKFKGTKSQLISQLALADLGDEVYEAEIRKPAQKRGLNANSYYWCLVNKLAEWSGKSDIYIHNDMLEHYGQIEMQNGEPVYVMLLDSINYKELSYIHLKWTGNVRQGKGGLYRAYQVVKGSHEYDTAEFSRLVDGLIQTIIGSEAPIETMTPAELAQLKGYAG